MIEINNALVKKTGEDMDCPNSSQGSLGPDESPNDFGKNH